MKGDVIGFDLSLLNSAAVLIPGDWDPTKCDWNRLMYTRVGYPIAKPGKDGPELRARRILHIVTELMAWMGLPPKRVYVEDYAYGMAGGSASITGLAELGGALKFELIRRGCVVDPVNQSTARKFLLGKLPPKDRAIAVHKVLEDCGCPWSREGEGSDPGDAFVVANYARTELGLPALTIAK